MYGTRCQFLKKCDVKNNTYKKNTRTFLSNIKNRKNKNYFFLSFFNFY